MYYFEFRRIVAVVNGAFIAKFSRPNVAVPAVLSGAGPRLKM
jgi:hypothetical protein